MTARTTPPCRDIQRGALIESACPNCGHTLGMHRVTDLVCSACEAVTNTTLTYLAHYMRTERGPWDDLDTKTYNGLYSLLDWAARGRPVLAPPTTIAITPAVLATHDAFLRDLADLLGRHGVTNLDSDQPGFIAATFRHEPTDLTFHVQHGVQCADFTFDTDAVQIIWWVNGEEMHITVPNQDQ